MSNMYKHKYHKKNPNYKNGVNEAPARKWTNTMVHGQKKIKFNNHTVVEVIVVRLGFLFISYIFKLVVGLIFNLVMSNKN